MAHYYFTRRAFLEIEEIYRFSLEHWGERVANVYMDEYLTHFKAWQIILNLDNSAATGLIRITWLLRESILRFMNR